MTGREILEIYPIDPLDDTVNYTFNIPPKFLSPFDLFIVIRTHGLEQSWKTQFTPPVAQVAVVNNLSKIYVKDYDISFDEEGLIKDRIDGTTYIQLEGEEEISTSYTLSIEGVKLEREDVKPEILFLKPMEQEIITVALGQVRLEVKDILGYTPPEGEISIYRITSETKLVKEIHWSGAKVPESITLPQGRYLFEIDVEGVQVREAVLLQVPETTLSKTFSNIGYPNLLEMALIISSLVIIIVEAVYNIRVWVDIFKRQLNN
jgi:hypothetical protein